LLQQREPVPHQREAGGEYMRQGLQFASLTVILLGELHKEKALLRQQQGFFFIDKRFEISNFLQEIQNLNGIFAILY